MAKPIAAYKGGINYLIEAAIRADGVIFKRYQDKGPYGYYWTKWTKDRKVDLENIPNCLDAGFSTLFKTDHGMKWRLPN